MLSVRSASLFAAVALLVGTAGGSVAVESVDVGATASSPATTLVCDTGLIVIQDAIATADGDGYGDLTQDTCPTLKNSHDDCVAPNTFVKTAPKRLTTKGNTAKAKIAFFSSEDGSTFTCTLDKAPAKPCTSAIKVKLKPGKHTVTISATDSVGNIDPTPAQVKIKVTKA